MNILALDDEKLALESLITAIKAAVPDAHVQGYRLGDEAVDYAKENVCEVAFIDIELRGESGLDIAAELKEIYPKLNIIFTTGYGEYAGEAFELHASGYIMKPITSEKIAYEINNLRYEIDRKADKLKVRTFGNFEVFFENQPLRFQYNKSKELLAYLIDRKGAMVNNQELLVMLWEDDDSGTKHISYLKNIRKDLSRVLESIGYGDVLIRQRGKLGIVTDKLSCDYYDFLSGKTPEAYRGEYMTQYSWAEVTNGTLGNL